MIVADNIKTPILASLQWLKTKIIENHAAANQQASRQTMRSLLIEQTSAGATLKGRNAFATLETGRRQGKTPKDFNQIIQQWVLDKGIPFHSIPYKRQPSEKWQPKYTEQQRGLMSISGAIAHNIATKGTSLCRQGGRRDIFTEPTAEAVTQIKQQLTGIFKTEIQTL